MAAFKWRGVYCMSYSLAGARTLTCITALQPVHRALAFIWNFICINANTLSAASDGSMRLVHLRPICMRTAAYRQSDNSGHNRLSLWTNTERTLTLSPSRFCH